MHGPSLVAGVALLSTGCALGNVRARDVNALGPYRELAVRSLTVSGVPAPQEVNDEVQAGIVRGLETWNKTQAKGPITPDNVLEVEPQLLEIHDAKGASAPSPVAEAASLIGAAHALEANRVSLLLLLRAPGSSEPIGELTWEGASGGTLAELADRAGAGAGQALAEQMLERKEQWVTRRAADERFLFAPSARLLDPGSAVFSDDEVLLFHVGVGITRWLEADLGVGGLPLPAAGSFPIIGHGVGGVGGAGILLLGAVDAGLRFRLLEEGPWWPGVAVSYDMLDAFAAALGGGAIFFAGNGIGGAAGAAAAGVNVQLNVFTAVANKRVGAFDFGAGTAVFDNHHFLPQSAGFAGGITFVGLATATYDLDRMPTVYLPFATAEATPWPWLHLIQEVFFQRPSTNSFGTTTVRLVFGPVPLSRISFKLDASVIEVYDASQGLVPLPWVGAGLYVL